MDFTFFVATDPNTLVVPKPQPESRLFAFVKPFQLMVIFSCVFHLLFTNRLQLKKKSNSGVDRVGRVADIHGWFHELLFNVL